MKAVSTENSDSKKRSFTAFSCTREAPLPLPLHRSKTWLGCSLFAKARLGFAQKKHFRGYQDLAEGLQSKARRLSFRQLCRQLSSKAVIRQKAGLNSFQSLFTNVLPIATFLNECTETIWRTDNSLPQLAPPPFISRHGQTERHQAWAHCSLRHASTECQWTGSRWAEILLSSATWRLRPEPNTKRHHCYCC